MAKSPYPGAPTMDDVARAAHVSKMTVSRALRGNRVAPETEARIRAEIERLHYVPHAAAGALASHRSGFVAVIVPSIDNANFAETVRGLETVLHDAKLELLLGITDYHIHREDELIQTMLRHRPEGIMLTGGVHSRALSERLAGSAIPVVETWDLPEQPIDHVVGFSNRTAGAIMTEHLAGIGRRRIAFLGGASPRDPRGDSRKRGYRDALDRLGLGPPRILRHGLPPLSMHHGAEGLAHLIERWPDTDALVCASDPIAFGAITECQRRGIGVPEIIAVGGFGDFEIARCAHPSITTIAVDAAKIGKLAGEVLRDGIRARRESREYSSVYYDMKTTLIVRPSTVIQ
ncbi:LacI family DNA-binding transcriptional regulator [Acidiphilium sp.]|uniref:LacI family DNA-binding transcriptional regulator n=1 Tax=Acidiphilium sp. TaxID=527 RepID=UPI003CFF8B28